jgi:uncharacterized protein YqeY
VSELKARLSTDLAESRKARDKEKTLVLSTTLSELRNLEIDQGKESSDEDVLQVIGKAIKQRRDAADQMRGGGRPELAEKEEAQADILKAYLPEQLSADDVRAIIREIMDGGATAMGPIMGQLVPRIRGRFDGKEANALVREALGA